MDLSNLRHSDPVMNPNQTEIPVTAFPMTDEGAEQFNRVLFHLKSLDLPKIERTARTGAICTGLGKNRGQCWDVRCTKSIVEITALLDDGYYRIQFRCCGDQKKEPKFKIFGKVAFCELAKRLKRDGIDIYDYQIDNGEEVKAEIKQSPKALVRTMYADIIFEHCYHADFHSSFPAGLANTHSEFRPTIEKIYLERNDPEKSEMNKAILNHSIGYMQSIACCRARWANLSRDAIHDNNNRVYDLSDRLVKEGYTPILYNVDGVWYADELGKGPYHGEGEGPGLGQWRTDKWDCIFRAKSAGCYEYIERGIYFPVMSGKSSFEKIKDRKDWEWGDIYRRDAIPDEFAFSEETGVFRVK